MGLSLPFELAGPAEILSEMVSDDVLILLQRRDEVPDD